MFLELIATFVAGLAAAGLVMLLNHAVGGRLPKWFAPVAAGLAMIGVTIGSEYGWYNRTTAKFPEGVEVVQTVESRALYRPWTYARPFVERFIALDTHSLRSHSAHPGQVMADTYFYGRWSAVNKMTVLADCSEWRRAALIDGVTFAEDGSISGIEWVKAEASDPLMSSICKGG